MLKNMTKLDEYMLGVVIGLVIAVLFVAPGALIAMARV